MPARVGRKQVNYEQTPARFAKGTLARIDASLVGKEKRSDFIRTAVEKELAHRGAPGPTQPPAEKASMKAERSRA